MVNASVKPEVSGEHIESLLRRFKKATDKAGIIRSYARARYFVPKYQKKAAKSSRARAKAAKDGQS
jgi:ribosomal protein S21